MKLIKNNWLKVFLQSLNGTEHLRIISPFINQIVVNHLIANWKGKTIQVITRFNLNDFQSGASSLEALKTLVNIGAEIKGIKDLHSKLYIFDTKQAIITSANFTGGGFFRNFEFGILTDELNKVEETTKYFEKLWNFDNKVLDIKMIDSWKKTIKDNKIVKPINIELADLGTSIFRKIVGYNKYFVKFYGTNNERAELTETVESQVVGSHCHFALTFGDPDRRPRRYNDGDIVFIGRMIHGHDYAVFGKAIAIKHNDIRDIASKEDIKRIAWKEDYPIYIRVHSAEFLNTTLENCPRLKNLMNELEYESFKKTNAHFENRGEIKNPRLSLVRKGDIELSEYGAFWLSEKFEEAKNKFGLISQSFIDSLYQGTP